MAYSRASSTMSSAARPVSSEARCGVHWRTRSFSSSTPSVCCSDVIAVFQAFGQDDVHHGERERGVGPGADRVVAIREFAGAILVRIDGIEPCPVAPGFDDEGPEMDVGAEDIGSPGDDQFRVPELFGLDAVADAQRIRSCPRRRRWSRWCGRAAMRPDGERSGDPCRSR